MSVTRGCSAGPATTEIAVTVPAERRRAKERRVFTVRSVAHALLAPRRFRGRRRGDRRFALLDRYDSGLFLFAVMLMLLSLADAVFTLMILEQGGRELNPLMKKALEYGVAAFLGVKMLLSAVPLLFLVATGNCLLWGRWRARSILAALTGLYGGLIGYELLLLAAG